MGILDKKTRFIDLVITQEGKRQIAAGKLRAELASLSDGTAFYDKSEFILKLWKDRKTLLF